MSAALTDDTDMRRRRALYRATHRGTKELDLMIGRFAAARLDAMEGDVLSRFEAFLALPDPLIQSALFDPVGAPLAAFAGLVEDVRAFNGLASDQVTGLPRT